MKSVTAEDHIVPWLMHTKCLSFKTHWHRKCDIEVDSKWTNGKWTKTCRILVELNIRNTCCGDKDKQERTATASRRYNGFRCWHFHQSKMRIKTSQLTPNGISQCPAHVSMDKIKKTFQRAKKHETVTRVSGKIFKSTATCRQEYEIWDSWLSATTFLTCKRIVPNSVLPTRWVKPVSKTWILKAILTQMSVLNPYSGTSLWASRDVQLRELLTFYFFLVGSTSYKKVQLHAFRVFMAYAGSCEDVPSFKRGGL